MSDPMIEDATWCWWTRPRAVRHGDRLFIGAIDSVGEVFAAGVDLASGDVERVPLAVIEDDDHNNPALVVDPDRRSLAFYSRHDADNVVRYRTSRRNGDISEWDTERTIAFPGATSYAQVHPRGDALHLFTRSGETNWFYVRSGDWGETWSTPVDFIALDTDQLVYMPTTLLEDGRTVRVAIAGHPKEYDDRPVHDVWACLLDLDTGEVSRPSTGEVVANVFSGDGLPLHEEQLDLVFKCPADRTVNIFDVSDGPQFEVAFASKVIGDAATIDSRYHVATLRDGEWTVEDVAPAGGIFGYIHAGMYVGGMSFPHRSHGGRVFATRESDGLWQLDEYTRSDSDGWVATTLIPPTETRLARPWAVTSPGDGPEVLALAIERYDDHDYMGVLSHVITPRAIDER